MLSLTEALQLLWEKRLIDKGWDVVVNTEEFLKSAIEIAELIETLESFGMKSEDQK